MSKEINPSLDTHMNDMNAGVLEGELDDIRTRHYRRNEADQEKRSALKRRIKKGLAIAAGIGIMGVAGNESLKNYDTQQELTNNTPGQQYLKQGLEDGSIDPSQAIHLHEK